MREIIISIYVGSGGGEKRLLQKAEHSRAIKAVYEDPITRTYADLLSYSNIINELASKGPESPFFKRTIEFLQEVNKPN